MTVGGRPFAGTRAQYRALRVRGLPEEPLRNACVAGMSVAENIASTGRRTPPAGCAGRARSRRARAS